MHALTVRTSCLIEKIENKVSARNDLTDEEGVQPYKDPVHASLEMLIMFKFCSWQQDHALYKSLLM